MESVPGKGGGTESVGLGSAVGGSGVGVWVGGGFAVRLAAGAVSEGGTWANAFKRTIRGQASIPTTIASTTMRMMIPPVVIRRLQPPR